MSNRSFVVVLLALGAIALLGFGLIAKNERKLEIGAGLVGPPYSDAGGLIDRPYESLGDPGEGDGKRQIADYRGKYVLINLWASWCTTCGKESAALQSYYERHRDEGFVILGINTEDQEGEALDFIDEYNLTYPMSRDSERHARTDYGSRGFPESFLVDPRGRLVLISRAPVERNYLEKAVTPIIRGKLDPLEDVG